MKLNSYPFDKRLYELLQQGEPQHFTTCELRDAYLKCLSKEYFSVNDVRRYVYEQIRRMLRLGWICLDEDRRKRDQIYHLQAIPDYANLSLIDKGFEKSLNRDIFFQQLAFYKEPLSQEETKRLELRLKEIQSDFISSAGEVEGYKLLLEEMPQLGTHIECEYLAATKRKMHLLGRLRSIEKVFEVLVKNK